MQLQTVMQRLANIEWNSIMRAHKEEQSAWFFVAYAQAWNDTIKIIAPVPRFVPGDWEVKVANGDSLVLHINPFDAIMFFIIGADLLGIQKLTAPMAFLTPEEVTQITQSLDKSITARIIGVNKTKQIFQELLKNPNAHVSRLRDVVNKYINSSEQSKILQSILAAIAFLYGEGINYISIFREISLLRLTPLKSVVEELIKSEEDLTKLSSLIDMIYEAGVMASLGLKEHPITGAVWDKKKFKTLFGMLADKTPYRNLDKQITPDGIQVPTIFTKHQISYLINLWGYKNYQQFYNDYKKNPTKIKELLTAIKFFIDGDTVFIITTLLEALSDISLDEIQEKLSNTVSGINRILDEGNVMERLEAAYAEATKQARELLEQIMPDQSIGAYAELGSWKQIDKALEALENTVDVARQALEAALGEKIKKFNLKWNTLKSLAQQLEQIDDPDAKDALKIVNAIRNLNSDFRTQFSKAGRLIYDWQEKHGAPQEDLKYVSSNGRLFERLLKESRSMSKAQQAALWKKAALAFPDFQQEIQDLADGKLSVDDLLNKFDRAKANLEHWTARKLTELKEAVAGGDIDKLSDIENFRDAVKHEYANINDLIKNFSGLMNMGPGNVKETFKNSDIDYLKSVADLMPDNIVDDAVRQGVVNALKKQLENVAQQTAENEQSLRDKIKELMKPLDALNDLINGNTDKAMQYAKENGLTTLENALKNGEIDKAKEILSNEINDKIQRASEKFPTLLPLRQIRVPSVEMLKKTQRNAQQQYKRFIQSAASSMFNVPQTWGDEVFAQINDILENADITPADIMQWSQQGGIYLPMKALSKKQLQSQAFGAMMGTQTMQSPPLNIDGFREPFPAPILMPIEFPLDEIIDNPQKAVQRKASLVGVKLGGYALPTYFMLQEILPYKPRMMLSPNGSQSSSQSGMSSSQSSLGQQAMKQMMQQQQQYANAMQAYRNAQKALEQGNVNKAKEYLKQFANQLRKLGIEPPNINIPDIELRNKELLDVTVNKPANKTIMKQIIDGWKQDVKNAKLFNLQKQTAMQSAIKKFIDYLEVLPTLKATDLEKLIEENRAGKPGQQQGKLSRFFIKPLGKKNSFALVLPAITDTELDFVPQTGQITDMDSYINQNSFINAAVMNDTYGYTLPIENERMRETVTNRIVNIAVLFDTSGSMSEELAPTFEALRNTLNHFKEHDVASIVSVFYFDVGVQPFFVVGYNLPDEGRFFNPFEFSVMSKVGGGTMLSPSEVGENVHSTVEKMTAALLLPTYHNQRDEMLEFLELVALQKGAAPISAIQEMIGDDWINDPEAEKVLLSLHRSLFIMVSDGDILIDGGNNNTLASKIMPHLLMVTSAPKSNGKMMAQAIGVGEENSFIVAVPTMAADLNRYLKEENIDKKLKDYIENEQYLEKLAKGGISV